MVARVQQTKQPALTFRGRLLEQRPSKPDRMPPGKIASSFAGKSGSTKYPSSEKRLTRSSKSTEPAGPIVQPGMPPGMVFSCVPALGLRRQRGQRNAGRQPNRPIVARTPGHAQGPGSPRGHTCAAAGRLRVATSAGPLVGAGVGP